MTRFTLVKTPSSYNVILGRPAMNSFKAVASAYHQKIKFPVGYKVREVRGDQPFSRKCYAETVKIDYKRARQNAKEGALGGREVCSVEESKSEYEKNKDVFAWAQGDLVGVSSQVAEHKLNINPGSRPVLQKKRHFGAEKDKVIAEQVQELLRAGHIKEIQFPTWLSNIVLVPKATGKWRMCVDFRDLNKACPKDCYPLPRIDEMWSSAVWDQIEPGQVYVWGEKWQVSGVHENAVSTVLIKEDKGDQRPVYYVGHALKGAEVRYTEIEKMALALVITARKLRSYFLSHPVTVLTNSLLGRIMTHPDASRRLMKWSVELGEYDIEYQPQEVWRVFVDGASSVGGSGVGIILISPAQEKIEIVVKLDFQASNNEAEYEAVIGGMQQAREVGQVNKTFCTREEKLIKYCKMIEELGASFNTWSIEQIPREENMEADALAKRAVAGEGDSRESLMQRETVAAIEAQEPVLQENTWKAPIVKYLTQGNLTEDKGRAWIIRRQAARFAILGGSLYRRSYQGPLLKCLGEGKTEYVLRKVHEGCCGNHGGSMSLVRRVLLSGYWWPIFQADASKIARSCEGCQRFGNIQHSPASNLNPIWASCPFDQWGLDIVGPFPLARAQKKFLLVAVDYFSKWVEAEPLAKITEAEVMKFLWKIIVCRFGLPRKLVSDNGRQFQGKKLADWCAEMGIKQARLHGMGKDWVEEIPSVLRAYRTTPHTATQESPFSQVYGSEAILPVEIGQPSARIKAYEDTDEGARAQELVLIEEQRKKAARRMEAYRARVMRAYNQKVRPREFQEGEFVLKRVNPAGEVGKLDARWKGPYKLIKKVGANTWYLQDGQGRPLKRPWNALHLKKYFV
ncbi:uncharacterized protein [Henckelia pumila]|uniref:uncharacterized protein n=1 Tax=Henckelia pumila TaxID=405737 RepID=UPI003C6DEE98